MSYFLNSSWRNANLFSFLTSSSTIILYVKIYNFFPAKWGFLAAIAIFEMGSLVCGIAPSSVAFIVGRAITGFGCAGINSGCQVYDPLVLNMILQY